MTFGDDVAVLTCASYDHSRVQGLASAIGMLVLVVDGRVLPTVLAMCTLRSVADQSRATLLLGPVCVLHHCSLRVSTGALIIATVLCVAHAVACYESTAVYGIVIAALALLCATWLRVAIAIARAVAAELRTTMHTAMAEPSGKADALENSDPAKEGKEANEANAATHAPPEESPPVEMRKDL